MWLYFLLISKFIILLVLSCFFFNDPATTQIYTLSLHDALPISILEAVLGNLAVAAALAVIAFAAGRWANRPALVHALWLLDRKSTRLNSSHLGISYAVFCLKKKK